MRLRGAIVSPLSRGEAEVEPDGVVEFGADGRITSVEPVLGTNRSIHGRPLVLPAFVDTHVHLPQIDVRGRYGYSLLPWLERFVFPAEAAFRDPEHAARVAERFFAALAAAGTGTACVFATVHTEATARAFEAAEASGLRVVMGKVLMDRNAPDTLLERADVGIRISLALAKRWDGAAGGRLRYALTPRFALSCSARLLAAVGQTAREAGLRVQTHLAEDPGEIAQVRAAFPDARDYLDVYENAGLVRPGSIFAHAVHCTDDEFRRIARGGGVVACCPTSNAFLGSGSFPLARAVEAGVAIGVGSDVGAGPQLSVLDVLRHFAYLGAAEPRDPRDPQDPEAPAERVAPEELLYRSSLAGAEALGFAEIGRVAPGFSADLVILEPPADADGPPLERFVQCVFRQPETRVVATLVGGRVVSGELSESVAAPERRASPEAFETRGGDSDAGRLD